MPTKIETRVLEPIDIVAGFGPDPDTAEVDRVVRDRIRSTLAETAGHTASWCSDDDSFRSHVV